MRIAVFDSNPDQAPLVCTVLTAEGHVCQLSANEGDFLACLQREHADLVLIDSQLSGIDSIAVIRAIRDGLPGALPLLYMVAPSGESELLAALAAGVNDYLVKPVRRGELRMRVRALLQRAYPEQQMAEVLRFGDFAFDRRSPRVAIAGQSVELTLKEFELALLFFRNLGRPLSRAYIEEKIWSREPGLPTRTLDTHVSRVRNKLGLRPENGFKLMPVYSYGYRLEQLAQ